MHKKQLCCPVCGFKRVLDSDERIQSEVYAEKDMPLTWRPDYVTKCKRCGNQIGIKKVS